MLEQPEGDEVVGAERGRRATATGEGEEPFAGSPAFGDRELGGLDHRERIRIAAGGCQRLAGADQSVGHTLGVQHAADEGDASVALLEQVTDGQLAADDVVDGGAAPVGAQPWCRRG